jgi:hypothetical protein
MQWVYSFTQQSTAHGPSPLLSYLLLFSLLKQSIVYLRGCNCDTAEIQSQLNSNKSWDKHHQLLKGRRIPMSAIRLTSFIEMTEIREDAKTSEKTGCLTC